MENLKLTTKPKRNYQFVQFLLDGFALFQIYLIAACIIDIFHKIHIFNEEVILASYHGVEDMLKINPNSVIIWGVLAVIVFLFATILPLVFVRKTKYTQKQFNMWVYAVYLIRILVLLIIFYLLDIHLSFMIQAPESIFSFGILATIIFIVVIIRFTQIRICAAEPKEKEQKPRTIVED